MAVKHPDSVEKILHYLDAANEETVVLSRLFFRDYTCPSHCGGCCPKFTLDFFEGERWERFKRLYPEQIERFVKRKVEGVTVYTDLQEDNPTRWCRNLDKSNGRCTIHEANPFTCEFELMKLVHMKKNNQTMLINRLFGRGWQYKRVDGGVGAKCEMLGFSFSKFLRDMALLKELAEYARRFKRQTKLNSIISFLDKHIEAFKSGKIPKHNIRFKS